MRIINVTQEDIDKGLVGDDKECGIARALKRQLGSALSSDLDKELAARVAEGVCVPGARANTFTLGGHNYYLPKKGRDFISKFDEDKTTAKPFSFALREVK